MKKINYPESRYRHCYGVGLRMADYAKNVLHFDEMKCKEMFILGNLHDIGYEFNPDAFLHDYEMADCMDHCNYSYASEIRYHSVMQNKLDSIEMQLLYFGDSTVDGMGNWCTFDERIADLVNRYGSDSEVVKVTVDIINHLKEKGFNDLFGMDEEFESSEESLSEQDELDRD